MMVQDISITPFIQGSSLALATPSGSSDDLLDWATRNRDALLDLLWSSGGILFRGFQLEPVTGLQAFLEAVSDTVLEYGYRSTPRSRVGGKIYTTTEYPKNHTIPLHCEMAYTRNWPTKLAFQCVIPAPIGGETPLADMAAVTRRIGPALMERFTERGVLYVRNYNGMIDIPWQTVFQCEEPAELERYCAANGIEVEWLDDGSLRTRQTCQGTARHPLSGEMLWFNQAHLFHVSSLPLDVRSALIEMFGEEYLPRNAYFADGSPIDEQDLATVRAAFDAERLVFPWMAGDVVLLDNMRYAHGRNPFDGDRRILVAMSDPASSN